MPEPFEIRTELDEGFSVAANGQIQPWQGVRVKYRALGSRGRFRSFLLEFDKQPHIADLQMICAQHERGSRASHSQAKAGA